MWGLVLKELHRRGPHLIFSLAALALELHALALALTDQGLLGYFLLVGPASRARTNQRQTPERNPPSVAGCRGARWPADRARQRGWLHAAASTGGCRDGCRAGVGAGLG